MKRWSSITSDPNSKVVVRMRRTQVAQTWRPPAADRLSYFRDACRDLVVLNLGCVDQLPEGVQTAPLHRQLSAVAARCVGVDIDRAGVESLRREGFDVYACDVTDPGFATQMPCSFDVVVAGEILEHVLNMGGLLHNAREVLKPGGKLLISTPNPYLLATSVPALFGLFTGNVDHVAEFRPYGMIELASRTGFELTEWRGEKASGVRRGRRRPLHWLARSLSAISPRSIADCGSIIYVFSKVPSPFPDSD